MNYSGHALRHTIATMVERQAGFETARKMLRHAKVASPTHTLRPAPPMSLAPSLPSLPKTTRSPVIPIRASEVEPFCGLGDGNSDN
jgi:hypothetical protein